MGRDHQQPARVGRSDPVRRRGPAGPGWAWLFRAENKVIRRAGRFVGGARVAIVNGQPGLVGRLGGRSFGIILEALGY